jgi:hypothetical protein
MKLTNVKAMVAKGMTAGLLASAFMLAAPAKAHAQGFAVGIQVGNPSYDYGRRDYYERIRCEQERREAFLRQQEWERQQAFLRHEAWERQQAYGRYGYGYRGHDWRDHDDHRDWDRDRH